MKSIARYLPASVCPKAIYTSSPLRSPFSIKRIFGLLDIIRNKLQWVGAGIPTTEDESAEVAGPDGPDSQGISHAAAPVLRTLRTSPRRHHAARHGAPAGCRWRAQRAVADRGAEIVVHVGLPEGLSPAGAAGRGVRVEPIAGEPLGASLAASATADPGGVGGDAGAPAEPVC